MARPLAAQQFDVLRQIFDLSRAQRSCIEREEFDRLAAMMQERDMLLAELQRLADEEAAMPMNVVTFPTAEDRAQQDSLALDTVIKGILEHDRTNESMLAEKMRLIIEELPTFRQGQRAIAGYRSANPETSSFMNRVS
ncbi:MAG: hypothetical protein WC273_06620 [Dehalococcoidia bacterium]